MNFSLIVTFSDISFGLFKLRYLCNDPPFLEWPLVVVNCYENHGLGLCRTIGKIIFLLKFLFELIIIMCFEYIEIFIDIDQLNVFNFQFWTLYLQQFERCTPISFHLFHFKTLDT